MFFSWKTVKYLPSVGPNFSTENAYVRGLAWGAFSIRQKVSQKKSSTNKSCKKYFPKVLSKIFLSKMYVTFFG